MTALCGWDEEEGDSPPLWKPWPVCPVGHAGVTGRLQAVDFAAFKYHNACHLT